MVVKDKITAFPDGNSFVSYNDTTDKLVIGNSVGLVKIFDISEPDLEPISIDISENLTSVANHGDKLLLTTTGGNLELVDLAAKESSGSIYRAELPLRDSLFINEGKRILCGGDENKLVIIDLENDKATTSVSLPDQFLNLAYNYTGELLAVSLANGDIQVYSVVNEQPNLVHTLSSAVNSKFHVSLDTVDYNNEHSEELISTRSQWSSDGRFLLVPSAENRIQVFDRANWKDSVKSFGSENKIIDFKLSPSNSHLVVLDFDGVVRVIDFANKKVLREIELDLDSKLPLNLAWKDNIVFVGTTDGSVLSLKDIVAPSTTTEINRLFMDEADESDNDEGSNTDALLRDSEEEDDTEEKEPVQTADVKPKVNGHGGYSLHEEDSMVIDADDDENVNDLHSGHQAYERRKRHKPNGFHAPRENGFASSGVNSEPDLIPYSPGSTPWSSENKGNSIVERRYLAMNSIGYTWSVRSTDSTSKQNITVSFFDRSKHKDYHLTDFFGYDLCSINRKGVLLGISGHSNKRETNNGKIFYRHHDSEQDAWERRIPLLKNEYITSICITNSSAQGLNNNATITVGTNFGYVRFFNLHGVCMNVIKMSPVVTMVSSSSAMLFLINRASNNVYNYSLIDINQDYKFIQQDVLMPLKKSNDAPLIKGIFFNEYNDPCVVPGSDDTLLVLQSWRETNNSKWIPILNCHNTVTEFGINENKKNWKCWPLGVFEDQLNCLILKNNHQYPGFPLPLPIELDLRLPILIKDKPKHKNKDDILTDDLFDEKDKEDTNNLEEEDPEENFLRSLTIGKLLSDSLNDENTEEANEGEILERLTTYSALFDKSLLKLFADACKEAKLNKALSIAVLIKTDKALLAASKIAERLQFMNLATRIGKLREDLMNLEASSEDEE
ncbi:DNA polymerase alpha binding protein [Scheffersomyces xylosifermentans]|uniref:DNA polymerase alpha binding protein n=1 Tax=Scheffersomyces xylosifermentans TaxID=1304137 RepID=UPI00315C8DEA